MDAVFRAAEACGKLLCILAVPVTAQKERAVFGRERFEKSVDAAAQFPGIDATTQEESIDWQTQDLTATIKKAEDAKNTWKKVGTDEETEAAAEAKIRTFFSITATQGG